MSMACGCWNYSHWNNSSSSFSLLKKKKKQQQQHRPSSVFVCVSKSSNDEIKGSGTTARGRRLLRIREEKEKREYERLHNYPAWAKVLEDACKNDTELRSVLGDQVYRYTQIFGCTVEAPLTYLVLKSVPNTYAS